MLRRLNEGPLLLLSFTNRPFIEKDTSKRGMPFTDSAGNSYRLHEPVRSLGSCNRYRPPDQPRKCRLLTNERDN